ncbi:MAG: hypothetical protein ACM3QZ_09370 [Solirubrobacterales bacterium]
MNEKNRVWWGIAVFTLLYPLVDLLVRYIPNPMVPNAVIALNIIFPVVAGFFYGTRAGMLAGGLGTAIATLMSGSVFSGLAIFPHLVMGGTAGWVGKNRSEMLAGLTVLIGHGLNILFFVRTGMLKITAENVGSMTLGLATEATIDIIAIILVITLLKRWLYQTERW